MESITDRCPKGTAKLLLAGVQSIQYDKQFPNPAQVEKPLWADPTGVQLVMH